MVIFLKNLYQSKLTNIVVWFRQKINSFVALFLKLFISSSNLHFTYEIIKTN
jgi:hypothetical protein